MTSDWFDKIIVAIGVVMLNGMLLLGSIQVLNRYIELPFAVYWTYEAARTLLALMTIIAIPYLFKNESDISFLPVLRRITTRTDKLLIIRNVFMGFLAIILVWSGHLAFGIAGDQTLPSISWFKIRYGYGLFAVASAILLIYIVIDMRKRITQILGENDV